MALLFVPPVRNTLPRTLPGRHEGNSLMRFFAPGARGANVFIVDGVVTEVDPGPNAGATVFHGGHEHYVTSTQAAQLVAAGYTVTTVADPVVFPGFQGSSVFPNSAENLTDTGLFTYGADLYGGGFYGGDMDGGRV